MIIVLFHLAYLLGKLVYRRLGASSTRKMLPLNPQADVVLEASQAPASNESIVGLKRRFSGDDLDEEGRCNIKFSPPAYIQRYEAVLGVLTDPRYGKKLKKVADFGCNDLSFCMYMKKLVGIEEGLFVDIDRITLDMYKERARPLTWEYLHRRTTPLVLRVLEGSVTLPDKHLENLDAVICIELVEHLYPEPLTQLPYNIFGFIRPKVAVVTTPNSDFNVLFTNLKGFRHPDHKFEWTRKQFEDWANNIVKRFPEYEVTFHGICAGPPGTEHLGSCSQMAVFHKIADLNDEVTRGIDGLFHTVETYTYPYEEDNRSDEEKILDDAVYYIRKFSMNDQEDTGVVKLDCLLEMLKKFYVTAEELTDILRNAGWSIVERAEGPVVIVPPPSTSSDDSINSDFLDHAPQDNWDEEPGPPNSYYSQYNVVDVDVVDEEDWDCEPYIIEAISDAPHTNCDRNTAESSTSSIYHEDMQVNDIETENRSAELGDSAQAESIVISSFSDTKDSDGSDRTSLSFVQSLSNNTVPELGTTFFSSQSIEETRLREDLPNSSLDNNGSIYSMFLEPSKLSENVKLMDDTEVLSESTIINSSSDKTIKKFKLDNATIRVNTSEIPFEEPQYTSSPHNPQLLNLKKRKWIAKNMATPSSSHDGIMRATSNLSKDEFQMSNKGSDDASSCSNNFITAHSDFSIESSKDGNSSENHYESIGHCSGAIPKEVNKKDRSGRGNFHKHASKKISPDSSNSVSNSVSPEVMDSGYHNSDSRPDLSPDNDLSSITPDQLSDSEPPSIADDARAGILDLANLQNRDMVNNNLDDEGNNIEADRNQNMNNRVPVANVLANDLENENNIYIV
ncbi:hypothetical protein QAD02_016627 [Eretmocerus hayati]|uniref:Uncharacterized protein n=1 Tax=Eretmocerus hayati TaxID=131215 RepID=A0ACC2PBP7_9HYME|nr:hypothetical protein QAD02_016627 [Eretmocerus hayati]